MNPQIIRKKTTNEAVEEETSSAPVSKKPNHSDDGELQPTLSDGTYTFKDGAKKEEKPSTGSEVFDKALSGEADETSKNPEETPKMPEGNPPLEKKDEPLSPEEEKALEETPEQKIASFFDRMSISKSRFTTKGKEKLRQNIINLMKKMGYGDEAGVQEAMDMMSNISPEYVELMNCLNNEVDVSPVFSEKGAYMNWYNAKLGLCEETLKNDGRIRVKGETYNHELGHFIDYYCCDALGLKRGSVVSLEYKSEAHGGKSMFEMACEELASEGDEFALFHEIIGNYSGLPNELVNYFHSISYHLESYRPDGMKNHEKLIREAMQNNPKMFPDFKAVYDKIVETCKIFGSFSDLYNATRKDASKRNQNGGLVWGHSNFYFRMLGDENPATEMMAETCAMLACNPTCRKIMQERMPKTLEIFYEIINTSLRRKKSWKK